jgi:hypothetical protein
MFWKSNTRKIKGKKKNKRKYCINNNQNISTILSERLAFQRKERQSDQFDNKSFLLSLPPLMASLPSLATEARYKIIELFRNITATRRASTSAISPKPASASSPLSVVTNVSENCNILHLYQF